jgi:hypothetical protein
VLLGAASSQLGYGAAGALILTILTGSLILILTSGRLRAARVFAYCASIWGSFWILGFRNISEPLSIYAAYAFLGFVCIPAGIAAVFTKFINIYSARLEEHK